MKSSLPKADRHDRILKQWDEYHGDLPTGRQGFHPGKLRQVMVANRQF